MAAAKKTVSDNMQIYEGHRKPPEGALKPITAGRLKGMSDINPMWRIKALTEQFGPCGIGWYYTVDKQWLEPCGNETVAFVNISLYFKQEDGEWSKPIFGNGGSKIVAQERNGAFVSDEAFKMAVTDAFGVACKQLGIAADVYFAKDRTKYTVPEEEEKKAEPPKANENPQPQQSQQTKTDEQLNKEMEQGVDPRMVVTPDNKMSMEQYTYLLAEIKRTDSMADIVKWAKTENLTTLSSSKCVAALTGLIKRATKNA